MGERHVSDPVCAGHGSGGTEGGGDMKVGRRLAVLLAVVLAVALTLIGARATPAANASAKTTTRVIWSDNVQKPAIDRGASAWGARRGIDVKVVYHSFGTIRDDLKTVKAENAPDGICGAHTWTGAPPA